MESRDGLRNMLLYGINPTTEAVRAATATKIWVSNRRNPRVRELVAAAESAGVPVERVEPDTLDRLARGAVHQGVVARVSGRQAYDVDGLLRLAPVPPLILVLDGIEDPQNFGALVRTADAAGAHGVVYQTRRASGPTAAAVKASAGAMAHVKLAPVVNIGRAVRTLKQAGVWTVGLHGAADRGYQDVDLTLPTALVVGAEGAGLRRIVREHCDWLVSIPMLGRVSSLNVSAAAAVALYEVVRQRGEARKG